MTTTKSLQDAPVVTEGSVMSALRQKRAEWLALANEQPGWRQHVRALDEITALLEPIAAAEAERRVRLEKAARAAVQLIHDLYDDEAIPSLMQYQVDGVKGQLHAALGPK